MGNTQRQLPQANNFFYKFYNYNIEDAEMLSKVPDELYGYVVRELLYYKANQANSRMETMQFNSFLFNFIKLNFRALHDKLTKDLKD